MEGWVEGWVGRREAQVEGGRRGVKRDAGKPSPCHLSRTASICAERTGWGVTAGASFFFLSRRGSRGRRERTGREGVLSPFLSHTS